MYSEKNSPTPSLNQYPVAQGDVIIFSYRGVFKEQTSTHILNWIERYLNSNSTVTRPESKKIFRVAVELIQNLIHHSSTSDSLFVFSTSESENRFSLSSTNLVDTKQSDELVSALCAINTISEDEKMDILKIYLSDEIKWIEDNIREDMEYMYIQKDWINLYDNNKHRFDINNIDKYGFWLGYHWIEELILF